MTYYDEIYEVAADNYGLITSAQAKELGISDKEMSRIAKDGRMTRLGRGLYRIKHHVPEENDAYAACVALVGPEAYLYGESVLAMHRLCPTNPGRMHVATPKRVRRNAAAGIHVVKRPDVGDVVAYEGIPSQSIEGAIRSCKGRIMPSRLEQATRNARKEGYISAEVEKDLLKEVCDVRETT